MQCQYPASPYADHKTPSQNGISAGSHHPDQLLEVRLMHEWMAYTCHSLSTTWEFWKYEIPLVAFEFRHILDALLAVTALSASRQKPRYWSTLDGKMISVDNGEVISPTSETLVNVGWKQATQARRDMIENPGNDAVLVRPTDPNGDMLEVSRRYFSAALKGHQEALATLNVKNFRAAYISSVLVSYYSLFTLSESAESGESLMLDPMKWFQLSKGTVHIIDKWREAVGERWFLEGMLHLLIACNRHTDMI